MAPCTLQPCNKFYGDLELYKLGSAAGSSNIMNLYNIYVISVILNEIYIIMNILSYLKQFKLL